MRVWRTVGGWKKEIIDDVQGQFFKELLLGSKRYNVLYGEM